MITLYQFPPIWGLPNASPFCMKLETYLRMAGLPYQIARGADIRKAPKGKMPYIEDQGKVVADSGLIVDYLKATYGDKLDAHLSPAERATALALQRLIEEHLYWCLFYSRWSVPENWSLTKNAFFGFLPPLVRNILPEIIRRKALQGLYAHGVGRHSEAEIYALGHADIAALSDFLGDKAYFLGDRPTALDATAYATLANLLWAPIESPLKARARGMKNLEPYCQRMKSHYYP
jgi:glutathione S-transferase